MKIGDLVRCVPWGDVNKTGVVVEMIQKKCWRTQVRGVPVNWASIDPEPHAVVLFSVDNGTVSIPTIDLEVV